MENKIKQIEKILEGETLSNSRTILQKINRKINDIEYDTKQELFFKT